MKNKLLYAFAILGMAAAVYCMISTVFGVGQPTPIYAQQDPFLQQRLNQIEQRFTLLENRLNQIDAQNRYQSLTPPDLGSGARDTDIRLLRSQVETTQLDIQEIECAVLRLDERTLSAQAKQLRKNSGDIDPCRETPNIPVQFSK